MLYQHRFTIELFFRFFKHVLGCRHLLSDDRRGIEIQTYAAIIACMLISLTTGHKPTKRNYEMVCYYFTGLAGEDELLAHLAKLKITTLKTPATSTFSRHQPLDAAHLSSPTPKLPPRHSLGGSLSTRNPITRASQRASRQTRLPSPRRTVT